MGQPLGSPCQTTFPLANFPGALKTRQLSAFTFGDAHIVDLRTSHRKARHQYTKIGELVATAAGSGSGSITSNVPQDEPLAKEIAHDTRKIINGSP